jgi:hypothetical protein
MLPDGHVHFLPSRGKMERNRVEDLLVETDGKSVMDVAREVATKIGWIG